MAAPTRPSTLTGATQIAAFIRVSGQAPSLNEGTTGPGSCKRRSE